MSGYPIAGGGGAAGAEAGAGEPPIMAVDAASSPAAQIQEPTSSLANAERRTNGAPIQALDQAQDQDQNQNQSKGQLLPDTAIILRLPHKYTTPSSSATTATTASTTPPLEWLQRTWTVTHSTLPMWRSAKNVRITYKIMEPASQGGPRCLDDTVTSVPTKRTLLPQPKAIRGVDTPASEGGEEAGWNWRGRGWLKITSSHWEVLGWGEREREEGGLRGEMERWVVTWFAPSLFTPAGVDVYCDNKGGISEGLFRDVERALERLEGGGDLAGLCKREMRKITIDDAEEGR